MVGSPKVYTVRKTQVTYRKQMILNSQILKNLEFDIYRSLNIFTRPTNINIAVDLRSTYATEKSYNL